MHLQEKACERAVGMQSFMESDQCLEDVPGATVTQELCLQTHEQIARHVKTLADSTGIHHVFIASDVDPRLSYIKKKLGPSVRDFLFIRAGLKHKMKNLQLLA
jgi:hypothetical protein